MKNLTAKLKAVLDDMTPEQKKQRITRWSGTEHHAGIRVLQSEIQEILRTPDPQNRSLEARVAEAFDEYVQAMLIYGGISGRMLRSDRIKNPQKLPRFHAEAVLITATSDRSERQDTIRELGVAVYKEHQSIDALHELMWLCCDYSPALKNQLLGDFNVALDGVGTWIC